MIKGFVSVIKGTRFGPHLVSVGSVPFSLMSKLSKFGLQPRCLLFSGCVLAFVLPYEAS